MAGIGATDLNLLVALRALLEEGNVSRAGGTIAMSQPAMSAALARLRRLYGDELLVRVGREYELTPLARALLPQVQQTLPLIEQALMVADEFEPAAADQSLRIALSDYAMSVLHGPLLSQVRRMAPRVRLDLRPIPSDLLIRDQAMLEFDVLIGPLGFDFPGIAVPLFTDDFVCIVDPSNERIAKGFLSVGDLGEMRHAEAILGRAHLTPIARHLAELGISHRIGVRAKGWLTLPFLVAGTDMVAFVPRRLLPAVRGLAAIAAVEAPFGRVELIEGVWCHPSKLGDPAVRWLRNVLRDSVRADDVAGVTTI
jgi:DNA-binding transcriptional LysR family regulator